MWFDYLAFDWFDFDVSAFLIWWIRVYIKCFFSHILFGILDGACFCICSILWCIVLFKFGLLVLFWSYCYLSKCLSPDGYKRSLLERMIIYWLSIKGNVTCGGILSFGFSALLIKKFRVFTFMSLKSSSIWDASVGGLVLFVLQIFLDVSNMLFLILIIWLKKFLSEFFFN